LEFDLDLHPAGKNRPLEIRLDANDVTQRFDTVWQSTRSSLRPREDGQNESEEKENGAHYLASPVPR
jgi:hypothetical protein